MDRPALHIPVVAWLLAIPGVLCLLAGIVLLSGDFAAVHPLLGGAGAGLALLVSAVALLGSAGFPIALQRLADRDGAGQ